MGKSKKWISKNAMIVFLLVIIMAFGLTNGRFYNKNIVNVVSQMSINALLATGLTYVIIIGGIDISVGSVAAFAEYLLRL